MTSSKSRVLRQGSSDLLVGVHVFREVDPFADKLDIIGDIAFAGIDPVNTNAVNPSLGRNHRKTCDSTLPEIHVVEPKKVL